MTPPERYFAAVRRVQNIERHHLGLPSTPDGWRANATLAQKRAYKRARKKLRDAVLLWPGYDEWKRATEELKGRP